MTLKLGYLIPTRDGIANQNDHRARPLVELAQQAEALGIDSVWIGDSLLAKPRHEPLTLLAAMGAVTERITLGTAVLLPMLRPAVPLAHQLATLDQICEGRLVIGIGTARDTPPIRAEFAAAGVPFEKRIGRMLEQVRVCRALWTGEPTTRDGLFPVKNAVLAPRPHTPGGPALWGGGSVDGALKRVGRYFDGWMPSGAGTAAQWKTRFDAIHQYATDAGRDPAPITGSAYVTLSISDSPQTANAALDQYLTRYYNQPAELIRQQQYCVAANRAEAVQWLQTLADAGAQHVVVRFVDGDYAQQVETLAALKAELV